MTSLMSTNAGLTVTWTGEKEDSVHGPHRRMPDVSMMTHLSSACRSKTYLCYEQYLQRGQNGRSEHQSASSTRDWRGRRLTATFGSLAPQLGSCGAPVVGVSKMRRGQLGVVTGPPAASSSSRSACISGSRYARVLPLPANTLKLE